MSQAQLEKFISSISQDPAELEKAAKGTQDPQEFVKNVHSYAKDKGYDFTEDEGKAWITDYSQKSAGGELQDSQLEAVAGGKGGSSPSKYQPPFRGGRLIGDNGSGVIGQNGANVIGQNGANFRR